MDAEAYEVKKKDVSNGIFISFLKRRVCEDEKVTVMLDRVAEGMWSTYVKYETSDSGCNKIFMLNGMYHYT